MLLFLALIFFIGQLQSQNNYSIIQYLKVHPSMENEYLELELEVWKKMHEARIEAGVLDGWFLFRVISPAGTKMEYNFVTVLQYNSVEKLSGHFESYGVDYTQLLSPEEIAFALRTPEIRDLVYEEVWVTVDEIMQSDPDKMFRYQVFNAMRMRPGSTEDDYQEIEQKYWKPMHQKRIDMKRMHGWGMYNMRIPGGTEREFHWATIDYYDDFNQYFANNDVILQSLYGEKEMEKIGDKTDDTRDLLRAEIRELLDYIVK